MVEYQIDFDGDWKIWHHIAYKFELANGYFVFEEVPGWLRSTDPLLHDIKIYHDENRAWAIFYFKRKSDLTAFLLKWS